MFLRFLRQFVDLGLYKSSCILFSCLFFVSCTTVDSKKMARSSAAVVNQGKCIQALSKTRSSRSYREIEKLASEANMSVVEYVIKLVEYVIKYAHIDQFNSYFEKLQKAGVEIPRQFSDGTSPMEYVIKYAEQTDFKTKIETLLKAGVEIPRQFSDGTSPMEYVIRHTTYKPDFKTKIETLLKAGVEIPQQLLEYLIRVPYGSNKIKLEILQEVGVAIP